jgi:hypothetical protein
MAPSAPESKFSAEGTDAHACLETMLKTYISGENPGSVSRILLKKHPAEMVRHALDAVRWIEYQHRQLARGTRVLSEVRVELPVTTAGQFGTVDAAIVEVSGELTVVDFKYGVGLPVDPRENPQLIYYALGLAHLYEMKFEKVRLAIIQPRAYHRNGPVRTWNTSVDHLVRWQERFEAGIQRASRHDAPLVTGRWCRWCPAAVICPKLSTEALKEAGIPFSPDSGVGELPRLNPRAIRNLPTLLDSAELLEAWIRNLREHATGVLERGGKIPGWTLVATRPTRKWVDIAKAERMAKRLFGSDAFSKPTLLSPAQLANSVGHDRSDEFIRTNSVKVSSGTKLAREADPQLEDSARRISRRTDRRGR